MLLTILPPLEQHRQVVVIDAVTTGPNPAIDQVIEVAALRFLGGHLVDVFETLVNPGVPISPVSSGEHFFTDADVADAPGMDEVETELRAFVGADIIVAHDADVGRSFLPMLASSDWLCSMHLARHLWPSAPSHRKHALRFWLNLKHAMLNRAGAQRAFGGALATGLIFERAVYCYLLKTYGSPTMADLIDYASAPFAADVLLYGRKHYGMQIKEIESPYLEHVLSDARKPIERQRLRVDRDTHAAILRELERRREGEP